MWEYLCKNLASLPLKSDSSHRLQFGQCQGLTDCCSLKSYMINWAESLYWWTNVLVVIVKHVSIHKSRWHVLMIHLCFTGWLKNAALLATVNEAPNISQRNVATCLRCGGIFNDEFTTNLLLSLW